MSIKRFLTTCVGGFLLLTGCARTELELNLAIYKDDPYNEILLDASQMGTLYKNLGVTAKEAETLYEGRRVLTNALYECFNAYSEFVQPLRSQDNQPSGEGSGTRALDKHDKALKAKSKAEDKESDVQKVVAKQEDTGPDAQKMAATVDVKGASEKVIEEKEEEPDILQVYLENHQKVLRERWNAVQIDIDMAYQSLDLLRSTRKELSLTQANQRGYNELQQQTLAQQANALDAIQEVPLSVLRLTGPLQTDFESYANEVLPLVQVRLESDQIREQVKNAKVSQSLLQKLIEKVNELAKAVEDQRANGLALSEEVYGLLATLAATRLDRGISADCSPEELEAITADTLAAANAIAAKMTAIPDSLSLNDRGQTALVDLTTSTELLWSQIDRLQDPADPIWRLVTCRANEKKWNTEFSKTYFMAEGDSSVVVVRDSPMDFRVQKGENDPSALVQAQLQISRAVADTAIVVAGAATGIDLSQAFAKSTDDSRTEKEDVTEGEWLAQKRALLKKQSDLRLHKIRALRLTLRSIRSSLQDSSDDPKAVARLISRLKTVLDAYESAFNQKEIGL